MFVPFWPFIHCSVYVKRCSPFYAHVLCLRWVYYVFEWIRVVYLFIFFIFFFLFFFIFFFFFVGVWGGGGEVVFIRFDTHRDIKTGIFSKFEGRKKTIFNGFSYCKDQVDTQTGKHTGDAKMENVRDDWLRQAMTLCWKNPTMIFTDLTFRRLSMARVREMSPPKLWTKSWH